MRFILTAIALALLANVNSVFGGNVTASIQGGSLYVYGNDEQSSITIDSPASGQIRVTGVPTVSGNATTVNSKDTAVVLNGWTSGVFVYLYGAADTVTLTNATVNGATHFDLGSGNDQVQLGNSLPAMAAAITSNQADLAAVPLVLRSSLFVLGVQGTDHVAINDTRVTGHATLDLGNEADSVVISQAHFQESLVVLPGAGADTVDILATTVALDLIVDDSTNALHADLSNISVGRNAFIYGTAFPDVIQVTDFRVVNLFQVFGESANDTITLNGQSKTLDVFAGLGNDKIRLETFTAATASTYLDAGTDSLVVQDSDLTRLNAFGGSENDTFTVNGSMIDAAYIYGDGGTDTFLRTASTIGTLKLFSIERK